MWMRQMTLDQIDLEGNGFHEALNAFIISPHNGEPREGWAQQFSPYFKCMRHRSRRGKNPESFPNNATVVVIRRCVFAEIPRRPPVFFFDMQTKSALDFRRQSAAEYLRELTTTATAWNNAVDAAASITRIMKARRSGAWVSGVGPKWIFTLRCDPAPTGGGACAQH